MWVPIQASVPEIFGLIFLLSACSAGFTPLYQAAVPDLLRDAAEYTKGTNVTVNSVQQSILVESI